MSGASRHPEQATMLAADLPEVVIHRGVISDSLLTGQGNDAVVLPVAPRTDRGPVRPGSGTAELVARYGVDLDELAQRLELDGHAGEVHTVQLPRALGEAQLPWAGLPSRLVLVGVGSGDNRSLRQAGEAVAGATRGLRVITTIGSDAGPDGARALTEAYLVGGNRCEPTGVPPAQRLTLLGPHQQSVVDLARHAATATCTARLLSGMPGNKSPQWLAERAVESAQAAGLEVEVLTRRELIGRGFGALLAVGGGSVGEPRLVTIRHEPRGARRRRGGSHVVIVGKGVTFDGGDPSLKSREPVLASRTDLAGAAVALATVLGAAAVGLPNRVTAVLPLAESGTGGHRPGDVLRTYGGMTVEVVNTDVEGRLVLADALSHADLDLAPDVLVDVATLTGAATLGLGRQRGALLTTDDALAQGIRVAGEASGEPVWRFPLVTDHASALGSAVADVRHVGDPEGGGGAITAALFLQRFVGRRRWAHLDLAGPARNSTLGREAELPTGFGARLLLRWLEDL